MANQISDELIEQIRNANDIVDVVGEYVQLKKQGRNYFGLCPFHGEKSPSFSVTQEKQIFHCFGCGKGGNVVTFLMEMESFNFFEAIKHLADRSGIELPEHAIKQESSLSKESQQVLSAHEWLTKLYHHLIRYTKDGKVGLDYLQERGITNEAIDTFQLGYAPNTKDFTATFLQKKGFHQQMLVKYGVLTRGQDDSVTDRFRGRVIFPIRNHLGRTVAFGARAMEGQEPKYLNSPESDMFQKGKMLYNFDLAKKYIRKQNEVVVFEGYMDVITAFQSGVQNVVATMGTAITEVQAKLLRRYAETVVICYDGDNAGVEATYKAAKLLQEIGCQVKIASLKDNLDPDSYINRFGGEAFKREVIGASKTFMSFYMQYLKKDFNLSLEGDRLQYLEEVLKEIANLDSSVEREFYVKELSTEYNISMESLLGEIEQHRQKLGTSKDKREKDRYTNRVEKSRGKLLPAFHNAERQLLAYMLQNRSIADKVQEDIGVSFNIDDHKIIATHLYAFYEEDNLEDVSIFIERIVDEKLRKLVIELALIPTQTDISDREINDYIQIIRNESSAGVSIKQLKAEQRLAEQQNDPIKAAQIALKIIELQRQVKHLN
ncbi:DNA primase [Ornithinibacillus massiliensis]|uniref:DNA primase n=1 Tax=Ornithinibacillus massiliensis TaxID=1944633 RepID=A0ABS5MB50_9BACI|nr:DNA primase [Ornithinibacillus massiliensis]MBS3679556.1 DNA primase [Ornithinibacillus massiliensis]